MRGRVLNENFDFNPKNLSVITPKPTGTRGQTKIEENKENDEVLKKKLEVI